MKIDHKQLTEIAYLLRSLNDLRANLHHIDMDGTTVRDDNGEILGVITREHVGAECTFNPY